jgi:predicted phage terminase large subunit-like protein
MQDPKPLKGILFPEKELKYFRPDNNLKFESALSYCDVADEGNDNLSAPIGCNIGDKIYITDVVFNKENSEVTLLLLAYKLNLNKVKYIRVESNAMGAMYGRNLQKLVKHIQVLPSVSTTNKHSRILMDAGFIKQNCYFVHPNFQTDEYKAFMKELCSYLKAGGSKHDDAPDSLSGLVVFIRGVLSHLYS